MSWSFRLARIFGTDVKVHYTFVLLLVVLWVLLQRAGGVENAFAWTGFLLALFLCVLLHEFGHILMASRFGIRTPDVILLPIGGVARLERMPEEPHQELLIALAGPAVTLLIAVLLFVAIRLAGAPLPGPAAEFHQTGLWPLLFYSNVLLLLFNLVPAFPLDGGRVLRALLARRLGHVRATRIAATIGQGCAMVGGIVGLLNLQLLWVLIALFVYFGAGQEAALVETRAAGRGIVVDQMMITRFVTIPIHATLRHAVDLLLEGEQREFPVVDNNGAVEGMLTRDNLIHALARHGPEGLVREGMTRPVPTLALGLDFETALQRLKESGLPALPVVDPAGRLAGVLTMDNVTDLVLVRQAVTR